MARHAPPRDDQGRTLLRDGHAVDDRRLDRLPRMDPRSLAEYPVAELLEAEPIARGKSWQAGPVLDQGREGACVGFAFAAEATAEPTPVDLDDPTGVAMRLYRRAQELDPWPETGPGGTAQGTDLTSGAKAGVEAGFWDEYRWARDVDELLHVLTAKTASGDAVFGTVVAGVDWFDGMYETDEDGLVEVSGRLVGGHAILLRGVLLSHRYRRHRDEPLIRWRNSWGPDYGVDGDGLIFAGDLERILGPHPELCVPVYRRRPA